MQAAGKPLWTSNSYRLELSAGPSSLLDAAEQIAALAWRHDFTAPGFCLLELGDRIDSYAIRHLMLRLKLRLSEICFQRSGRKLVYRSLGRFDQQETTKFHLDGAPDESLLVLGYEPSKIRSRLLLADYSQCAFDLGVSPLRFLDEHNPMFIEGEQRLDGYITELPQPPDGGSRIVFINNSRLPFTEARTNSLGVMHKAEIMNPTESERRIVNSMMLSLGDADEIGADAQVGFATTDTISQKFY